MVVNPPAALLGQVDAILWGKGRREYHVDSFAGPLSVKSLVRGSGRWQAGKVAFAVDATSYLVLNSGQQYSVEIESREPVESFCPLNDPFTRNPVGFPERRRSTGDAVAVGLQRLRAEPRERVLWAMAESVARLPDEVAREMARLSVARLSTRQELYRRVLRGKAFLDDSLSLRTELAPVAREACLSPFHFIMRSGPSPARHRLVIWPAEGWHAPRRN